MAKKGILIACITLFTLSWASAQVKLNDIVWDKTSHDFGEIEFGASKIKVAFTFTNRGKGDFVISRVHTSCNCTEPIWPEGAIKPGMKGVVTAIFDPTGLAGEIDKSIEVFANFTDAHSFILHVTGKIKMPELPAMQNDTTFYPGQFGYIRFNQYNLFFGDINNDTISTRTLLVVNDYNKKLSLKDIKSPKPYITIEASQMDIEPGDTGRVNVTIDASKVNDLGEVSEQLVIETNDRFFATKSIGIYFNVKYAFEDSKRAKRRAPKIFLDKQKVEMGEMNEGGKKKGTITVTNNGKQDLKILKIYSDCSCTVIKDYPDAIKKGESVELTVEFDALFKSGPQSKVMTLYTNDPENPMVSITVTAMVQSYK